MAGALKKTVDLTPFNLTPNASGGDDPLLPAPATPTTSSSAASATTSCTAAPATTRSPAPRPSSSPTRSATTRPAPLVGRRPHRLDHARTTRATRSLHGDDDDAWHPTASRAVAASSRSTTSTTRAARSCSTTDGTAQKDGLVAAWTGSSTASTTTARSSTAAAGSRRTAHLPGVRVRASDGNDVIFGDLGNDWLVGGTGQDTLWAASATTCCNADDDLDDAGRPQRPARHAPELRGPRLRRRRPRRPDRQHRRRPPDRLGRRVQHLHRAVRAVRHAPRSAAACRRGWPSSSTRCRAATAPTRRAPPTPGNSADRNGEPDGELGMVPQKDHGLWQDQTGGPSDPQPGNIPGGKRDVLRTADFNDGVDEAFAADSGALGRSTGGAMSVAAASTSATRPPCSTSTSTCRSTSRSPPRSRSIKPTGGWKANAYIIFDYFTPDRLQVRRHRHLDQQARPRPPHGGGLDHRQADRRCRSSRTPSTTC